MFTSSANRSFLRRRILASLLIAGSALASSVAAAPIAIPNGDFSDTGNFGSIGGGLIGGSDTDVPIGAGPWTGTYNGVLGLLAPPTLAISDGAANISGLAAANVLGILNNGGYFSQTLTATYEAQKRYTLTANVDSGAPLDIGLLAGGNFGIALRSGGVVVASSATAPPQLIDLQPLGGSTYVLTLSFDSGDTTTGAIDVQLFSEPEQLIGASLMTSVTFSAITLDGTAINPVSGSIDPAGGTPQTATVGEPFSGPLEVRVTNVDGDPVPGVTVTFAAPATGASATFSADTVQTDNDGRASVTATANTVAGDYTITATVDGVDTPASFNLTNSAGPAAATIGALGTVQSAPVNTAFPQPLVVLVTDEYDNPVEGVDVTFAAPGSGATAILSDTTVATDATGLAQVQATANGTVGSYQVTAAVDGIVPAASYTLTNRVDDGTTIDDDSGDDQSADLDSTFGCSLLVTVRDSGGTPQAGYAVDFTAPDTGASATLTDGVVTGTTVRVLTDSTGNAEVAATANDIPGSYVVTAQLVESSAPAIEFGMSNIEGLIFSNGFDTPCSAFGATVP